MTRDELAHLIEYSTDVVGLGTPQELELLRSHGYLFEQLHRELEGWLEAGPRAHESRAHLLETCRAIAELFPDGDMRTSVSVIVHAARRCLSDGLS